VVAVAAVVADVALRLVSRTLISLSLEVAAALVALVEVAVLLAVAAAARLFLRPASMWPSKTLMLPLLSRKLLKLLLPLSRLRLNLSLTHVPLTQNLPATRSWRRPSL
jgi:hypothetical protein